MLIVVHFFALSHFHEILNLTKELIKVNRCFYVHYNNLTLTDYFLPNFQSGRHNTCVQPTEAYMCKQSQNAFKMLNKTYVHFLTVCRICTRDVIVVLLSSQAPENCTIESKCEFQQYIIVAVLQRTPPPPKYPTIQISGKVNDNGIDMCNWNTLGQWVEMDGNAATNNMVIYIRDVRRLQYVATWKQLQYYYKGKVSPTHFTFYLYMGTNCDEKTSRFHIYLKDPDTLSD